MRKSKELLFSVNKNDFDIIWYSGTGAGGQHRNKHQNCCRIKHKESGAEAVGTETKSRDSNLRTAFKRLTSSDTFKTWLKRKAAEEMLSADEKERIEKEIERKVDEQMKEENLLIEYL